MVDLGLSNVSSVVNALARVDATARVSASAEEIERAAAVVLPGVGSFADGMRALRERGLVAPLQAHAAAGRPLLGICLGMQLLGDGGVEGGPTGGLALVPGRAVRIEPQDPRTRIPNIGWCDVRSHSERGPLDGGGCFYFAHSYALIPDDPDDVAGEHDVGGPVVSAVRRGSVSGVQFHPEKSQDDGLAVLARFRDEALAAA